MKDKTKKILAALGIGLTLGTSAFTMSGCSVELSESQSEHIDELIENANEFMSETTETLDEHNTHLSEIAESLSDLYNSSFAKEAARLTTYAISSIWINRDNIWDNLKITYTGETNESGHYLDIYNKVIKLFKKSDNENVMIVNTLGNLSVIDEDDGRNEDHTQTISLTSSILTMLEKTLPSNCSQGATEDNIIGFKILANGNYLVSLFDPNADTAVGVGSSYDARIADIEINSSRLPVSATLYNYAYYLPETQKTLHRLKIELTFEYNTLTEAEIQADIDAYNA